MTTPKKIPFPVYRVGGCVRDALLGEPINDIDYVVVGGTPDAMLEAGYKPVIADFPVFLHPETSEEYALARTERKTGPGYSGFTAYADPSVTLEEDLSRRDFTINAMAMDNEGNIIDPYNGQDDLQHGVLRHVGPAFADDPLRVLRGARFAARYGFTIADETFSLMTQLVDKGEMEHLTRERIYLEFTKGFTSGTPSAMLLVLNNVGALSRLFPEANQEKLTDSTWYTEIDRLTILDPSLGWAYLMYKLAPSNMRETGERWRCQKRDTGIATLVGQFDEKVLTPKSQTADLLVSLWSQSDARRQWDRFEQALHVYCVERGLSSTDVDSIISDWKAVDVALRQVEEGVVLKSKLPGEDARACIFRNRVSALNQAQQITAGLNNI